jgi:hypothetical protein
MLKTSFGSVEGFAQGLVHVELYNVQLVVETANELQSWSILHSKPQSATVA